jgi:hypothetical protein
MARVGYRRSGLRIRLLICRRDASRIENMNRAVHGEELEEELRRILEDHARALAEQREENDRPLRRGLYEIILNQLAGTDGAKNEERAIFTSLAFLSGIVFVLVAVLKILTVL